MIIKACLIMVIDDNPGNLKLVGDIMEIEGYEVIRCEDAEHALVQLQNIIPDLILMDIALPGMDGLDLTRSLRQTERTKNITIIALTAYAMKGDLEKALAAGCDGYITKPINTRLFPAQITEYLNLPKGPHEKIQPTSC